MNALHRRRPITFVQLLLGALLAIAGPALAKPYEPGTRVVTMVVEQASREQVLKSGDQGILGQLHEDGISDDQLTDQSVAVGIVYCCGGKITRDTAVAFYVPPDLTVAPGDIVELAVGFIPTKKERKRGMTGKVNRAVLVRDNIDADGGACRWDPPNEALWMRVLYCDWMLSEGWDKRGGLNPGWFRAPPAE